MRRLALVLSLIVLVGMNALLAQTKTITGTVVGSEDGDPIPGISVVVKGTTIGTITRVDGTYSLSVPEDATNLLFSFVGMTTQDVVIDGRSVIDISMVSEAIGVDEVVVTALGISREKKSLGYASQGVSKDALMKGNNANPMEALSGKVAGLSISGENFSGSQNILIRGASSFSGNNQPLFIVDGVPISNEGFNDTNTQIGGGGYDYGTGISDLNSNDIESIDVLKGSAASALYGSRGQNGVIMITTKKGKAGKSSFSVEVNSGVTFQNVSIIPNMQSLYGGGGDTEFETKVIDGKEYKLVNYGIDESWGPRHEGQDVLHWWGVYDYEQGLTSSPVTAPWTAAANDVDSFYETGVAYQNSVNIVTTSEKSSLRVGYTNVNTTGTVPNSSQNKNTFNVNGSTKLWDGFAEVNANMTYVNTYTKGRPQFGYGDNSQSQKFFQWGQRQVDMNRLSNYMNPDGTQRTWNRNSFDDPAPHYSDNPYWTAYKNYQDDDRNRVYGTTGLKLNFTDYLSAQGSIYLETYTWNMRERVAKGSQAQSMYKQTQRQATEINYEGKITYHDRFEDFDVTAFIGANKRTNKYHRFEGETNGGLVVADLYNLNNSVNQPLLDDFNRAKNVNSMFGAVSVGYKNMVYVDATYRSDWDSSLPNANNKYSYASVSGSWIISNLLDVSWMDNLKVRVNYGETGNGTAAYQVYNTYPIGQPFNGSPQFTNSTRLKNSELKPEQTSEIEFGLEGAFFQNRLGFDFSYYNRDTENQIVPVEISGASGYLSRVINAGSITNKGIELVLRGTPIRTNDFTWGLSVNFAKNTNVVNELPTELGDKLQLARAPFGGAYLNAVEGATFQELYAYRYVFDDKGNRVIDPSTGFYQRGELESVGSVLPDYTAGVSTTFTYKSFDLNALFDISQGGKYYSLTNMWGMYSGMHEDTATPTSGGNTIREDGIVVPGVMPDGSPNTEVLDAAYYGSRWYHSSNRPSETSVFDASYVKLRNISLGYKVPQFVDAIKSLKVSIYARNLAVWGLDNTGIDPETVVGGSGNIQGLEGGIVPATRSYGLNVSLKF